MSHVVWSDPQIERIVQQVCTRTGLRFRESQRETVELGIRQAMRLANQTSLEEYGQHLARHSRAFDDLIIELTVGETYFFRDTGQIEFIRRNILPELCTRRGLSHEIRIWSAGCATGEEAYSLAMLCADEGLSERTQILATDISRRSLDRAQKGHFSEWSLRGEGAGFARKYLRRDGDHYQVDPKIHSRVRFEYLNLALDVYPSVVTGTRELDLILCRNVMIYFDRETIASVARRFFDALAPGGWVMTAAGDPSLEDHAPFETVLTTSGLFYRRGPTGKALIPNAAQESLTLASSILAETWPRLRPPPDPSLNALTQPAPPSPDITSIPVAKPPAPIIESLETAQRALEKGHYQLAAEIAAKLPETPEAAAIRVQALANTDLPHAERVCAELAQRYALSAQLQYLHAVLLLDLNREQQAAAAARRAVYLDSSLAIAHFTLGSVLRRVGDVEGARRSFRNARDLCAARPADELVRFSDGEHAGTLARAAKMQLEGLNP